MAKKIIKANRPSGSSVITIINQKMADITTPGGTLQLKVTVLPANATDKSVTWSIENGTGKATISTSGLVTAVENGTVTVTATANDGSGVKGTLLITITNQKILVTGITISA
jgi:uncharacterized protein YjdB